MNRFAVTLLYIVGVTCMMQGWIFFGAVAAIIFSLYASTLWILPAAILIDGYFGMWYEVPIFSLVAASWFMVVEFLRPHVTLWQNDTT